MPLNQNPYNDTVAIHHLNNTGTNSLPSIVTNEPILKIDPSMIIPSKLNAPSETAAF